MESRRHLGFSLTEVLIVIVIIALLAALIFPVITNAKSKSLEVPCTTNLRQFHVAWAMYMEANNDRMPLGIEGMAVTTRMDSNVLRCPADRYGGVSKYSTKLLAKPVSYYYLPNSDDFRDALEIADANFGIAYCVLHGRLVKPIDEFDAVRDTTGLVLRLRRDGSIQHAKVGNLCSPNTPNGRLRGRQRWSLLTDVKCVEPFCDGLTEPCE
jgi:prepilin-type N-terminal cleavage/methylation domain-containing protein